jgi:hypothetical protein
MIVKGLFVRKQVKYVFCKGVIGPAGDPFGRIDDGAPAGKYETPIDSYARLINICPFWRKGFDAKPTESKDPTVVITPDGFIMADLTYSLEDIGE